MRPQRRDKLVYFRISSDEFEELVRACEARGARNLSEFARAAVQAFVNASVNETNRDMTGFLKGLQTVVDELKENVQQLTSALATRDEANCNDQPVTGNSTRA